MNRETKIRIAKKTEKYITITMFSPFRNEIILRRYRHETIEECIDDLEETLTHELLHSMIFIITQDDIITASLDNITLILLHENKNKYSFYSKKTGFLAFQIPE